ncbi:ATP-binding cassette domain-containing protein [Paenibacillus segetis]|uniref:Energy-coupling factor transporter ATP-binding protein EcfA2 n=1 Tax=Paenibacillus segetis TaxID=1325360 RepID=A0ABQ1YCS4_9BACL|nr:ATP-binding cassette domain-containing protein [Paenibacillus segetis]GGH21038.1 energy-coupling factor transporter ATP-binding protein EcfA2 [Paenibacillus segetis]
MVYQLSQVSVSYGDQLVLQNVSCTIQDGKWISVIGQTGAGKSTFVKVLKGLIPSFVGDYCMDQQPIARDAHGYPTVVPHVGYVFQYPEHQLFERNVYRELAFAPKLQQYSDLQITEMIDSILPQVGLSKEILPMAPFQLSGGEKRRVAVASVLMMNPQLLIVDEPTAGLDPVSRLSLLSQLKDWQQQDNRTVIFVSHQMNDVAEYSDEVIVFHEGRLMGHYEVNNLFLEHSDLLVEVGLSLPEPVQLLHLIEELSGQSIQVESCREQDIFEKVWPIWHTRSFNNG